MCEAGFSLDAATNKHLLVILMDSFDDFLTVPSEPVS
jgi:hypothetical protein